MLAMQGGLGSNLGERTRSRMSQEELRKMHEERKTVKQEKIVRVYTLLS